MNFPSVFIIDYDSLNFQELRSACVGCACVLQLTACVSVPRIGQKVTNHSDVARRQPMINRVGKIAGKRQLHCLGIPHDSDFYRVWGIVDFVDLNITHIKDNTTNS